ncbi:MAG TPA: hypothetical protein VMS04_11545 [Vicinamibacterales bacterium]|nr:hypothetical protein [Vicinamibacterales bacterium]
MLVGVFIADLANRGQSVGAGLVGTLAAISFGVELRAAVPLGMLSHVVPARTLMTSGALLAGITRWMFGLTQNAKVFVVSRALVGPGEGSSRVCARAQALRRIGLSDITRAPGPPAELSDLMSWVACLADARSAATYSDLLAGAGLTVTVVENHDEALTDMIRSIAARLFATEVLAGLGTLDLDGIDLAAAKRLTKEAKAAVSERRLGYAIVSATKGSR